MSIGKMLGFGLAVILGYNVLRKAVAASNLTYTLGKLQVIGIEGTSAIKSRVTLNLTNASTQPIVIKFLFLRLTYNNAELAIVNPNAANFKALTVPAGTSVAATFNTTIQATTLIPVLKNYLTGKKTLIGTTGNITVEGLPNVPVNASMELAIDNSVKDTISSLIKFLGL
jgi:hypothetical protein